MRESEIERYLCERVAAAGGHAYKFASPARRNVPDRLVFLPRGRVFLVECKAPGRRPRAGQQREIDRLVALGARVYLGDTREAIDSILRAETARKRRQ